MIDFDCEMFPTPMIINGCKKREREIKLRPDRDLPDAKFMCVEPEPAEEPAAAAAEPATEPAEEPAAAEPMELDEDEREPFVFLAIPLLIRCVNVPY